MVRTATKRQLPQRVSGGTGCFALFAIAVLQLGIALHHDEHDATELTGDCVVCIQHEQFDDLVTSPASAFVIVPDYAVAATTIAAFPASRLLPSYHGRAPPTHS